MEVVFEAESTGKIHFKNLKAKFWKKKKIPETENFILLVCVVLPGTQQQLKDKVDNFYCQLSPDLKLKNRK